MEPKFQVQLKIRKPVAEVFDAVVDNKKLGGYFVEKGSAPLTPGATVMWKFPELDDEFPVIVGEVVPNERLSFEWEAAEGGYNTLVEMAFKPLDARRHHGPDHGIRLADRPRRASRPPTATPAAGCT